MEQISSEPSEKEGEDGTEQISAEQQAEEEETDIPMETADSLASGDDYSKFYLFCHEYQFTVREQNIFRLLLKNKNYSEISEELYISIGTAKAHIHNIFIKAEVKKRSRLIALFEKF